MVAFLGARRTPNSDTVREADADIWFLGDEFLSGQISTFFVDV